MVESEGFVGEREEEMEGVREGVAGGQGLSIHDKWLLTHDITPLAAEFLASRGVC